MSKTWKAAESRIGTWFGAKGIKRSGRVPLSGSNSGKTSSDSPHPTIYIESKRATKYHSVIKFWRDAHESYKSKPLMAVSLPVVQNGKVVAPTSHIWCIRNRDFEDFANYKEHIVVPWSGPYPAALSLYQEAVATQKATRLDKDKEVVLCALVYHGHPGFWITIDHSDIAKCWDLIIEARKDRERMIIEEGL